MNNRALEFLNEAYGLLAYWGNHEKARLLVRLALGEVEELQDRLAAFEGARPASLTSPTSPAGRGVLIVDAQRATLAAATPAALVERPQRAALSVDAPADWHGRL